MEEQPVDEAGGVDQAAVEQPGPLSLDGVVPSVNNGEVEEHKTDAIPVQNGELLPGEENGEQEAKESEGGGGGRDGRGRGQGASMATGGRGPGEQRRRQGSGEVREWKERWQHGG